jgi:hypothetical protein
MNVEPVSSVEPLYRNHKNPAPCSCNMPVYSLMAACGAGQNGMLVTWGAWIQKCKATFEDYQGTIPQDATEIPGWAFLKVPVL